MSASHCVLWTGDYCRKLKKAGDVGKALRVMFGGSHQSQPSLTSFGVQAGDYVYPIRVDGGRLMLVARMRVARFVSLKEYLSEVLGLPPSYASLGLWELEPRLEREHPEWGHLLPWGCLVEVALGEDGSPIQLDRVVPTETVMRLRFAAKRGERPIKYVEDGLIKRTVSLQGRVNKLTPEFARECETIMGIVPPGEASG